MGIVKTAAEILAEIGDEEADERPPLTGVLLEVVDAVADFTRRMGYPPFPGELAEILDVPATVIRGRVRTLRQQGYLAPGVRGHVRSIRLAGPLAPAAPVAERPEPPCPSERHDVGAYANGWCRCPLGRAARAQASRELRAAQRAAYFESLASGEPYLPNITHGLNGYRKHGCRCTTCRRAHELEPLNRSERVA